MTEKAFQDFYTENYSVCYGCGKLNTQGLQIKSYWDGDESVCHFTPEPYHTAVKGVVYGGLIASVIDCHGTGTAAAMAYREQGRPMGTKPDLRYVTASLHVDYLKPTPINAPMELRAKVDEIKGRKTVVSVSLFSKSQECVRGKVVAVQLPQDFKLE
ncbi:MAG: PaaI family thioesterase [Desulfobacteraceae bacterium]|nr:PaaI family thioesterase [Desulfobacteraceae bacterium]